MSMPMCKVVLDGTDYINEALSVTVKRRENNYDVATIVFPEYISSIANFDTAAVYFKDASQGSYAQVFGGHVRQANVNLHNDGIKTTTYNCKGYGAALEDTYCNRDYGLESSNPSLCLADDILLDLIDNFVEKSFADSATGQVIAGVGTVSDFCATTIKYINNPYRANIEVADIVAALTSAIGNGTTAGAHWIVVPDGATPARFLFAQIGDHTAGSGSPEAYWPDWWITNEAGSTLVEGEDFTDFVLLNKAEEYANKVVLVTDFRKPAYDYYTEDGVANGIWDKDGTTLSDATTTPSPVVGSDYIEIADATAWFPAAENAGWDITKWGSYRTIPRLNFYMYKNDLVNANCQIRLFTTDHSTDYFYCALSTLNDPDDEWIFKSIPIGPYYATAEEARSYRWSSNGSPDWSDINGCAFYVVDNGTDPGVLCLDDLHFSGKLVRSAYNSGDITAKGQEIQKVLIARNAMDDSCVASDDTGFAGRIARAELLRRSAQTINMMFTIGTNNTCTNVLMMPGQKIHVHALKTAAGTFIINNTMRTLMLEHNWNIQTGLTTTITSSSDLYNSHSINGIDQYALWQENMFLNNAEARNIRTGAEVDLSIPIMSKNYA